MAIVDLSNITSLDYYGICKDEAYKRDLIPAIAIPYIEEPSDWITIGVVLFGFFLLSGIIIMFLTKAHEKVRLKRFINLDIKRRETEKS